MILTISNRQNQNLLINNTAFFNIHVSNCLIAIREFYYRNIQTEMKIILQNKSLV